MMTCPSRKLILYIQDVLYSRTDEAHPRCADKLCAELYDIYDIKIERKAMLRHINTLIDYGMDIVSTRKGYYVRNRPITLGDVKTVDADAYVKARMCYFLSDWQMEELDNDTSRIT